jgi:putative FmdB family regulatory protein
MPIYEYLCEKCGSHVEVIQKISDAPLKRCAKCRGKLEKTVSRTSFQLKGSGWYVTDYSRKDAPVDKGTATGKEKAEKASDKKAEAAPLTTVSGDKE